MHPQSSYAARNCKAVCNVVLLGSYLLIGITVMFVLLGFGIDHAAARWRLGICLVALVYILITRQLARREYYHLVAYMLVTFYMSIAIAMAWRWGINTPIAILLFGFVIVLTGVSLTARCAIRATIIAGTSLVAIQIINTMGWYSRTPWMSNTASSRDVIAYCVVFSVLALIACLYNREMERLLAQAEQAEVTLLRQKATLELRVKRRTAELRHVQLEEMQQMYRFAELGQLGATLVHDMANYLTALTLEIEDLESKQHSKAIARAREITQYLEDIVNNTCDRLRGGTQDQVFDSIHTTSEAVRFLQYKAAQAGVEIDWQPPARSWKCRGDPESLSQVVVILINNAIDAYGPQQEGLGSEARRLVVAMYQTKTHTVIKISDWGKGIAKDKRQHLFKPFHSTKKTGLGIGLFIARQTVQANFGGTLTLSPRTNRTEFIVKLPRDQAIET